MPKKPAPKKPTAKRKTAKPAKAPALPKLPANLEHNSPATVRLSKVAGRGVFASREITRGKVIMTNVTLQLTEEEAEAAQGTLLAKYWFGVPGQEHGRLFVLGLIPMLNHGGKGHDNCKVEFYETSGGWVAELIATRNIKRDEELLWDYGKDYDWGQDHTPKVPTPAAKAAPTGKSKSKRKTPRPRASASA